MLDNVFPQNTFTLMLIPVLKKGAIYSLVCVSMNLLNGFTGLFVAVSYVHSNDVSLPSNLLAVVQPYQQAIHDTSDGNRSLL